MFKPTMVRFTSAMRRTSTGPGGPSNVMVPWLSPSRHQASKYRASAASASPYASPQPMGPPCSYNTTRPLTIPSSSSNGAGGAKNQVFDPVRNEHSLQTYLSLSTASDTPLLTLWTASWCPSCRHIAPLIRSLIAESRIGETSSSSSSSSSSSRGGGLGGVNYVPVEFDAPDAQALAVRYMITSIPTLLAFDPRRGEPAARVTDARKLADRQFLVEWIEEQARKDGGGGGGGGGSAFGGLFGNWK